MSTITKEEKNGSNKSSNKKDDKYIVLGDGTYTKIVKVETTAKRDKNIEPSKEVARLI